MCSSKFESPSNVPGFAPSVSRLGVNGSELIVVALSFQLDDSSSVPVGVPSEVWFEHPFSLRGAPNAVDLPNGFSWGVEEVRFFRVVLVFGCWYCQGSSEEGCKDEEIAQFVHLVVVMERCVVTRSTEFERDVWCLYMNCGTSVECVGISHGEEPFSCVLLLRFLRIWMLILGFLFYQKVTNITLFQNCVQ